MESCRRLLVSDIDGTLLRQGEPTPGLATLRRLIEHDREDICLVYATGRSFASTMQLIERDVLPGPDGIAPLVGSEVWLPPWHGPDPAYERFIGQGWNRELVEEASRELGDLVEQPAEFQTPHKLSFFTCTERNVRDLEGMLEERGVDARLVYSGGRYLDALPRRAGKRAAARWIRCRICGRSCKAIACGDSLNDLDILVDQQFRGVVVGNAEEDLCRELGADRVYQSSLPYAAGVIEGAEVHGFWR